MKKRISGEKYRNSSPMKISEISVLAQLLTAIKDAVDRLEDAQKENDRDKITSAKKEIMDFQRKISEML